MTVYVLIRHNWDDHEVIGVYRRYQDADQELEKRAANQIDEVNYDIEEHVLAG